MVETILDLPSGQFQYCLGSLLAGCAQLFEQNLQFARSSLCGKDPRQHGFDFGLWTRKIVQAMIATKMGVRLCLSSAGNLLAVALPTTTAAAGVLQVPLPAALLATLPDGTLRVRLRASDGTSTETALAALLVDRKAPALALSAPAPGGGVRGAAPVRGTILDDHLASWSLTLREPSGDQLLGSGGASVPAVLGNLQGLSEGPHALLLQATDLAGNSSTMLTPFVSDMVAPLPGFLAPLDRAVVGSGASPYAVLASLAEANLRTLSLELQSGAATEPLRTLARLDALPASGQVALWDLSLEPDGPARLTLSAEDLAGNRGTASVGVTVDNTPPRALLGAPRGFVTAAPLEITGTADDLHFARYTLSLANGPASTAVGFVPLEEGSARVGGGLLASLPALPSDGVYTLRLDVADAAGNQATDLAEFVVDTTPPHAPQLTVAAGASRSAALQWTAPADADVAGYLVLRGRSATSLVPVAGAQSALSFLDTGLGDGAWSWAVVAIDAAGLHSAPSNVVSLEIDTAPPSVALIRPTSGSVAGGTIEVIGTATKSKKFARWTLSVGAGASPASFAQVATGTAPVIAATLARLAATSFPDGSVQTLRGVERVGGWFLRGDAGLKMIPGDIRDTGNTYEADLLVVRPGAQSQHLDATFRVEAGKITAINIAPR